MLIPLALPLVRLVMVMRLEILLAEVAAIMLPVESVALVLVIISTTAFALLVIISPATVALLVMVTPLVAIILIVALATLCRCGGSH
jgi:hypothetical protein